MRKTNGRRRTGAFVSAAFWGTAILAAAFSALGNDVAFAQTEKTQVEYNKAVASTNEGEATVASDWVFCAVLQEAGWFSDWDAVASRFDKPGLYRPDFDVANERAREWAPLVERWRELILNEEKARAEAEGRKTRRDWAEIGADKALVDAALAKWEKALVDPTEDEPQRRQNIELRREDGKFDPRALTEFEGVLIVDKPIFGWVSFDLRTGTTDADFAVPLPWKALRRESLVADPQKTNVRRGVETVRGLAFNGDMSRLSLAGIRFRDCRFLKNANFDGADLTDARFENCRFDATVPFEAFAQTLSFKENRLVGLELYGDLDGWDFSEKNVGDVRVASWKGVKIDGARFDPPRFDGEYWEGKATKRRVEIPANLPNELFRRSRFFDEKDLSGTTFYYSLNGGDFSGFDLTDATLLPRDLKLGIDWGRASARSVDGAIEYAILQGTPSEEIRVKLNDAKILRTRFESFVLYPGNGTDGLKPRVPVDFVDAASIQASKSWRDKDLRGVYFGNCVDLRGANLAGVDLSGATFETSVDDVKFDDAVISDVRFCSPDFSSSLMQQFDVARFNPWRESGLTLEQAESTWNGRRGRFEGIVFPDDVQKTLDRRAFEASPEFAAKDFSGKILRFRDMSGWDLSGLNLTGCVLITRTLDGADLTGATVDGAIFLQANNENAIDAFAANRIAERARAGEKLVVADRLDGASPFDLGTRLRSLIRWRDVGVSSKRLLDRELVLLTAEQFSSTATARAGRGGDVAISGKIDGSLPDAYGQNAKETAK